MKITIEHENNVYLYDDGYYAYILDCALYNGVDKKYGIDELRKFVYFVGDCYLKDSNPTPLGFLTDFMAKNWENVKDMSRHDILCKFYAQL